MVIQFSVMTIRIEKGCFHDESIILFTNKKRTGYKEAKKNLRCRE